MFVLFIVQEEDVLDMLAQCEADEKEGKLTTSNKPRGLKVNFDLLYTLMCFTKTVFRVSKSVILCELNIWLNE